MWSSIRRHAGRSGSSIDCRNASRSNSTSYAMFICRCSLLAFFYFVTTYSSRSDIGRLQGACHRFRADPHQFRGAVAERTLRSAASHDVAAIRGMCLAPAATPTAPRARGERSTALCPSSIESPSTPEVWGMKSFITLIALGFAGVALAQEPLPPFEEVD